MSTMKRYVECIVEFVAFNDVFCFKQIYSKILLDDFFCLILSLLIVLILHASSSAHVCFDSFYLDFYALFAFRLLNVKTYNIVNCDVFLRLL